VEITACRPPPLFAVLAPPLVLEAQQPRKTKVAVMIVVLMPIRWTLPRFRYAGDAAGVVRPVFPLSIAC
jgi:hypothetical protein